MNLHSRFKRKQDLPNSNLMERIQGRRRPARYRKPGTQKTLTAKIVVITLGLVLSLAGVSAAVSITIRGNSSSTNEVSLGVGKADANTCDTNTINTDTTSRWFDSNENFMIEKVEIWGVEQGCALKTLTLVMNYSGAGTDQTYTCSLPTTSVFSINYNLATFIFSTTAIATSSNQFRCTQIGATPQTLSLTTTSTLAGTAVQIL